jgi:hypothetical protein
MILIKFKTPLDINLEDDYEPECECDDCGATQHIMDVLPLNDPQNLVIGDIIPAGSCSELDCHGLMYLYETLEVS